MRIVLFGAGHQAEQARQKRRDQQRRKSSGTITTYHSTSTSPSSSVNYFSPNRSNSHDSSWFPFSSEDVTSSQRTSPHSPTTDTFRRSPEPMEQTGVPILSAPVPRKTEEKKRTSSDAHLSEAESDEGLSEAEIIKKELEYKANASKRMLPSGSEKNKAHNANVREAREKCKQRGIKWD